MRDVTLEIPLRALAFVGGRKRRDPADPRIETLRDTLDDSTLAGSIAPLEDNDELGPVVLHPILQPDQFALQSEQFFVIDSPIQ